MGCFQSKPEIPELHSNIFRVVNINESGAELLSGELEITETDIVLYREGRGTTVWPLHSLRRYGYETEIFSFESGRRCDTGEGIYAFRCRRASALFRTLQQQINLRNVVQESVPYSISGVSPLPQGRQNLQGNIIRRSSVDNGQSEGIGPGLNSNTIIPHAGVIRGINQSPRSPSNADILEVTPLYPQPRPTGNHVTNIYQLREFKREHNNNQSETIGEVRHEYINDLNRDLAILRNNLRKETAINTMRDIEDEARAVQNKKLKEASKCESNPITPKSESNSMPSKSEINPISNKCETKQMLTKCETKSISSKCETKSIPSKCETQPISTTSKYEINPMSHNCESNPLSPTLSTSSEHYAQLCIEQDISVQAIHDRFYVNVKPKETIMQEVIIKDIVPNTPLSPKQVDYLNPAFSSKPLDSYNYANLLVNDKVDGAKSIILNSSELNYTHKVSESDTLTSLSPIEELEVNYAILDIETSKDKDLPSSDNQSNDTSGNTLSRGRLISQNSMDRAPATSSSFTIPSASIGYTTIDFDKTVALTSVAASTDANIEACRKARHSSSSILCSSPSSMDKSRLN